MKADDRVKAFQAWLRNLSYNVGPVDGIFGLRTAGAYAELLEAEPERMNDPIVAAVRAAVAEQVPESSELYYGPVRKAWAPDPTPDNPEHCKLLDTDWYTDCMVGIDLPLVGFKKIHRLAAAMFKVLMAEAKAKMRLDGLVWEIKQFYTWNFRLIRGSKTKLSEHGRGDGFDVNHSQNPRGVVGNQPTWFVEIAESWGWTWGGRWKGKRRDDMHFQWSRV
jgi:hypothetical protein